MNRIELIEKIAERLIDPWTDNPHDYEDAEPIDLEYAKTLLEDLRHDDAEMDDPDYCLPAETTPELLMEVFNCIVRKNQHELLVERLADWLTDNECVCEYDNYFSDPRMGRKEVYPVDFLYSDQNFLFPYKGNDEPTAGDLIEIGLNSKATFNPEDEYCWYDPDKKQLFSSNRPFHAGAIDAEEFARFILSPEGEECLEYIRDDIMDDEDRTKVFGKGE